MASVASVSAGNNGFVAYPSQLLSSPLFSEPLNIQHHRLHHSVSYDDVDSLSSCHGNCNVPPPPVTSPTVAGRRIPNPLEFIRWLTSSSKSRRKDSSGSGGGSRDGESHPAAGYLDDKYVRQRLIDADLHAIVLLPSNVDHNEWIASHVISLFEHVNIIYGCVSEYCVQSSLCSTMTGPLNYFYVDERGRRPKCSASQYIDSVMSVAFQLTNDETCFPTKYGHVFADGFESTVRKIVRSLLHVIGHVYHAHWLQLARLRLLAHLNTTTHHLLLLAKHFSLADTKELDVLGPLLARLEETSCLTSSDDLGATTTTTPCISPAAVSADGTCVSGQDAEIAARCQALSNVQPDVVASTRQRLRSDDALSTDDRCLNLETGSCRSQTGSCQGQGQTRLSRKGQRESSGGGGGGSVVGRRTVEERPSSGLSGTYRMLSAAAERCQTASAVQCPNCSCPLETVVAN